MSEDFFFPDDSMAGDQYLRNQRMIIDGIERLMQLQQRHAQQAHRQRQAQIDALKAIASILDDMVQDDPTTSSDGDSGPIDDGGMSYDYGVDG